MDRGARHAVSGSAGRLRDEGVHRDVLHVPGREDCLAAQLRLLSAVRLRRVRLTERATRHDDQRRTRGTRRENRSCSASSAVSALIVVVEGSRITGGAMQARTLRMSNQLVRTVTGPMWHGPALAELLRDVSSQQASARPIAGAHTIWELVLHTIAWADIARARLHAERIGDPTPQEDWPPVATSSGAEWTAAVSRLQERYQLLATEVRQLDDAVLDGKVAGSESTAATRWRG